MEVKQEGSCDKRGHGVKHSLHSPHRHGNCKAAELWGGIGGYKREAKCSQIDPLGALGTRKHQHNLVPNNLTYAC